MKKLLVSALATFGLLIGLLSMATPFPGGTVLIAICISILIFTSSLARAAVLGLRANLRWVDKALLWVADAVGHRFRFIRIGLHRTNPARIGGIRARQSEARSKQAEASKSDALANESAVPQERSPSE